jgi:hypothetical protein
LAAWLLAGSPTKTVNAATYCIVFATCVSCNSFHWLQVEKTTRNALDVLDLIGLHDIGAPAAAAAAAAARGAQTAAAGRTVTMLSRDVRYSHQPKHLLYRPAAQHV